MNLFDTQIPTPDFRVPFQVLLSANDVQSGASRNNAFALAGIIKKWRRRGRSRTMEIAKEKGLPKFEKLYTPPRGRREVFDAMKTVFFKEKVVCIVRIWRPNNADYDVHNPFIKPILDGMVDVNLISDDSFKFVTDVFFHFESVDETLKIDDRMKQARKQIRDRNKTPPPLPSRFYFDFYRLSRFPNCNPIAEIKPLTV